VSKLVAEEGKGSGVGGVDDDASDEQAQEHDHEDIRDVSEHAATGEIVTRNSERKMK
jgi:hypothetical protein